MKDRSISERRCVVTGQSAPKEGLIRFVVGPDTTLVPDLACKLPGRGMWLTADAGALKTALKKGAFSRAARAKLTVPDGLEDVIEAGLKRRVQDALSLARKAGQAIAGYEKVKSWLENGEAAVLIQASDGSERGKGKLRPPQPEGAFIGALSAEELGLSFGRTHVIHAALTPGGLADRAVEDAKRLAGMRQIGDSADQIGDRPGKE